MDTRSQINRTLWVHEVVGGLVTNILFITRSYGFIHSVKQFSRNALVKKMYLFVTENKELFLKMNLFWFHSYTVSTPDMSGAM